MSKYPLCGVVFCMLGCSDYDLKEQYTPEAGAYPEIEITPSSLSFTEAEVGSPQSEIFTITNVGEDDLNISGLELLGDSVFTYTEVSNPSLAIGASTDVIVTYSPTDVNADDSGSILVSSNDPDNSVVEVPLWGTVEPISTPILQIDPLVLDLGNASVGQTNSGTFLLESVGDAPVTLSSFSITGTDFSAYPTEGWPLVLDPGASTLVDVYFAPTSADSFSEIFTVDCEDPATDPTATIVASSQDTQPIADCSVDPAQIQPNSSSSATWYGSDSYDPSGAAISTYTWTLISKPIGSQASMPGGGANRSGFQPDLAGDYVAELVVTNEYGASSEPCEATLVAVPGQDLWVQMSWAQSGDDMDLHLVRNNGTYTSSDDCYYANCTFLSPDWGVQGDPSDDPSLDQDDISGTGPENITLASPAAGTYTVVVHDHTSNNYSPGNDVTVVIFLGGVQVWSDTRSISGEGTYLPFAEISYPSATVTGL